MTSPGLKKQSLTACTEVLVDLGFAAIKSSHTFLSKQTPDAYGWVGLNLKASDLPRALDVNPTIGVRHKPLERALANLCDDLPTGPLPAVTRQLGYLMPERSFRTWVFSLGKEVEPVAREIEEAIAQYGLPFIEKFSQWSIFSAEIESCGLVMEHMRLKFFPTVRALNGDIHSARELVRTEAFRIGESEDFYAASYRRFAERFDQRFPEH